jgi:hypothetical protein
MPIAVAQSPSKLAVALPAILADRGNAKDVCSDDDAVLSPLAP